MGDEEEGDLLLVEVVFEPFHHFDIKVVGGLVHDQQHMFGFEADVDQGPGKGDPFPLTTGQFAGRLLEMVDIQFAEDLFDLGVEVPGIQLVEPHDGVGQAAGVFRVAGIFVSLDGIDDGVIMMKDIVEDGPIFDKRGFLFEEGHGDILVNPYGTVVGGLFAGEDTEQR